MSTKVYYLWVMKLINHGLKFVHTIPSARSDNTQQVHRRRQGSASVPHRHKRTNHHKIQSEKSWVAARPSHLLSADDLLRFPLWCMRIAQNVFLGDTNAPSQKLFAQTYKDEKLLTKAVSSTQAAAELLLQYLSCIYPWSIDKWVIDILSDVITDITL